MKSFVRILTFFVVLFAICSSGTRTNWSCHVCTDSDSGCAQKGGGKKKECINSAIGCGTIIYKDGSLNRVCLDGPGAAACLNPTQYKCHMCEDKNFCNTEDSLP